MDNKSNDRIKYVNIAITNRCNLKCIMCDIWKEKPKIDLSLDDLKKIFENSVFDDELDLTITGGEPFLHPRLFDVIKLILAENSSCLKNISTNGTMTKEIIHFLNYFKGRLPKDFSLHISLDGVEWHDKQRGSSLIDDESSLERIKKTIQSVRANFPLIAIKIKFTITPVNYNDLIPTYEFCKANDLDFRLKLVETAVNYTNKTGKLVDDAVNNADDNRFVFDDSAKERIVMDLSEIYNEKLQHDRFNADFIKNTINFLQGKADPFFCNVPFKRIFIMPDSTVYSCIHFDKIGSISEQTLDDIWNGRKAESIREDIKYNKCNRCVAYHGLVY